MKTRVVWGHVTRGDPERYLMLRGSFFLLFIFLRLSLRLFVVVLHWSPLRVEVLCSAGHWSQLWQHWWGWVCGCRAMLTEDRKLFESLLESVFSHLAAGQSRHKTPFSWTLWPVHLPEAVRNENKPIVLNVSPVLSLENWYNLFPMSFLDQTILRTRS